MSVIKELTEGEHNVVFKDAPGYESMSCQINIRNGVLTCIEVNGSAALCGRATPPGAVVEGAATLNAYLKAGATVTDLDTWVASKGGKENITYTNVMMLRGAYHKDKEVGFTVTYTNLMRVRGYLHGEY